MISFRFFGAENQAHNVKLQIFRAYGA
jgi:hypothetical protein